MGRSLLHLVLRHAEGFAAGPEAEPDSELLRRFCRTREEAAFVELLRRHGPMIWAACRQSLAEDADAEDAFQATFLALIRSARTIREGRALAGWLHGVAVRAALKIKRSAVRRRQREERSARTEAGGAIPDSTWDTLLAAVHEEVQRLPGPLRTAFVMCELEGVRQPEAAARLGWKPGTLTGRLARARQLLIDRLLRRGLAPALVVGSLGFGAAAAAVPHRLMDSAMSLLDAGGAVSPAILTLANEVIPMTAIRMKMAAALLLAAGGMSAVLFPMAIAQQPASGGSPPSSRPSGSNNTPKPEVESPTTSINPPPAGPMAMAPATRPAQDHWEYKIVVGGFESPNGFQLFVDLGAQGWEYAGSFPITKTQIAFWQRTHPRSIDVVNSEFTSALIFKRSKNGTIAGRVKGADAWFYQTMTTDRTGGIGPAGGSKAPGFGPGAPQSGGSFTTSTPNVPPADSALKVLKLQNAKAADLAILLEKVFPGDVSSTADQRTNSLIIRSNEKTYQEVKLLIEKLDVPSKP